jgi:hypothetical protein
MARGVRGAGDTAEAIAIPFDLNEHPRDAAPGPGIQNTALDLARECVSSRLFGISVAFRHDERPRHNSFDSRIPGCISNLCGTRLGGLAGDLERHKQNGERQRHPPRDKDFRNLFTHDRVLPPECVGGGGHFYEKGVG